VTTHQPVAALPLRDAVLDQADGCCQCTGACGNSHTKGGGRCEHTDGSLRDKHHGPLRLLVAPADPARLALPFHRAARLPADQLAAWCAPCHDKARNKALREHRTQLAERLAAATDGLF
jgi:hypothetical protein